MSTFTQDQLKKIMRECGGVDDLVDLDGDIGAVSFEALGYDSLAVLEMTARIEQECAISIPDDAISTSLTPDETVSYVNNRLRRVQDGGSHA